MTTNAKIENTGHYEIVVNVCEVSSPDAKETTVERYGLKPGESSPSIVIYGWRRFITILEMAPREAAPATPRS